MRIISPYTHPQRWLKGNLHTHTTLSDGDGEFEQTLALYEGDNYDFLAVTDHAQYYDGGRGSFGNMLLLPAQECHIDSESDAFYAHVVSLGPTGDIPHQATAQEIIDDINSKGGIAILCHPRWSFMPYDVFDRFEGYAAFEVYNAVCDNTRARGFSSDYWDRLMKARRKPVWAVAVDDSHRLGRDFATGWTMVNAEKDPQSIYDALVRGDAYATCGPRIETIKTDDDAITLHTSSAKAVKFMGPEGCLDSVEGEHVKVATYRPTGDELFVRAQVHGHDGAIAWTNPFFIEPQNDQALCV